MSVAHGYGISNAADPSTQVFCNPKIPVIVTRASGGGFSVLDLFYKGGENPI